MKLNYFFIGTLCALVGFSSCQNIEETSVSQNGVVKLNAVISSTNSRIGSAWTGSEALGIYMIANSSDFTPMDEEATNKKYLVETNGNINPHNNLPLTYPADGASVKFVAYHPHTTISADHLYSVDLSDSQVEEHDLMYASTGDNTYNNTQTEAVNLVFTHQLAKLTIALTDGQGQVLNGATGFIERPVCASFDLKNGLLTLDTNSVAAIALSFSGNSTECLVLPAMAGKATFTVAEETYTWDLSGINIEAGKKYNYTLKLNAGSVQVVGTASITDWTTVEGGSIDIDKDETDGGNGGETDGDGDGDNIAPIYTSSVELPTTDDSTNKSYAHKVSISGIEYDCLKLGTSSAGGTYTTSAIGLGKTKIVFYALGWNGTTGNQLKVSSSDGMDKTFDFEANSGVTSNSPYTIDTNSPLVKYELELSEVSNDETTITFSTVENKKRAVIFGVNAE